jgi:hypothetical protein
VTRRRWGHVLAGIVDHHRVHVTTKSSSLSILSTGKLGEEIHAQSLWPHRWSIPDIAGSRVTMETLFWSIKALGGPTNHSWSSTTLPNPWSSLYFLQLTNGSHRSSSPEFIGAPSIQSIPNPKKSTGRSASSMWFH